ncbi:MAG: hypothetical protein WD875_04785 [Pirellulales bacterium]
MARSKASRTVEEEIEYDKQTWNVYSMMLLLALLAIVIGCIFLVLELKAYDWKLDAKISSAERPAAAATLFIDTPSGNALV